MSGFVYDLYGAEEQSADEVRMLVEGALDCIFSLHDSDYMGGEYFLWSGVEGERLIVQSNQIEDEEGEYLQEPDFPDFKTILLVERTLRGDTYRVRLEKVGGLKFLRRQSS